MVKLEVMPSFKTPILFLIFNRPDETFVVFNKLKELKPANLFIASDGPREYIDGEADKCISLRNKLIKEIDWECNLHTLFRNKNLGCAMAVSESITWFFDHVEEGIILEDDCLPQTDFFLFCEQLLDFYRHDSRIFMISGHNALDTYETPYSYVFSKLGAIWGWASWRRAWKFYDHKLTLFPKAIEQNILENVFSDYNQLEYRKNTLLRTINKTVDSWAYRWTFSRLINSGLSIVSSKNLIKNIGFGSGATHNKNGNDILANQPIFHIDKPLNLNDFVVIDQKFDDAVFYKTINFRIENKKKHTITKRIMDSIIYRSKLFVKGLNFI
jgi:hypothetical protein